MKSAFLLVVLVLPVMLSAQDTVSLFQGDEREVTLPSGLTVFAATEHIFTQIPLHLNYLELMKTNEIAQIQAVASTFYTETPMDWRTVLREVVTPQGLDFIEDGGMIRLGSVRAVEDRYQQIEQDRLRRNRSRIEVNFSEGVQIYRALGLIRNLAKININFDYMAPADRGIVQQQAPTGKDDDKTPQGPPPKMTTYATPENQPVEWRVVMREVLGPHGYDFVETAGVVRPMTQAQVQQWQKQQVDVKPLVTRLVRIYHMDPAQMIARLQAMKLVVHSGGSIELAHGWSKESDGKSVKGGIVRQSSPPAVLIRDIEENMDTILHEIKALDTRERQIMIEARILDLGRGATRQLGVQISQFGGGFEFASGYGSEYLKGRGKSRSTGSEQQWRRDVGRTAEATSGSTAGTSSGWTASDSYADTYSEFGARTTGGLRESAWARGFNVMLNPLQVSAIWDMVQTSRDSKVVSQPVLVVSDHAESFIQVVTEIPYSTKTVTLGENRESSSYEWNVDNFGVDLRVIPEITADGKSVRLSVLPEITDRGLQVYSPDGTFRFEKHVRKLDTRVTVQSGHTLLMGGLLKMDDQKSERKIPFLGDLPLIGWLFKWNGVEGGQRNLVMLITPTILDDELPDTGYEQPAQPHFVIMRRGMEDAMRSGVDDSVLREVEAGAKRRMLEYDLAKQEEAASRKPMAADRAVLTSPVAVEADSIDPEFEQRMQEIEEQVLRDLE